MKKIRLSQKKLLVLLVMLTTVSFLITVFILAKYSGAAKVEGDAVLQSFDVSLNVVSPDSANIDENGVVELEPEKYKEFQLEVEKTGAGWAYIRISIEESWLSVDENGTEMVITTSGGGLSTSSANIVTRSGTDDKHLYVKGIVKEMKAITVVDGTSTPNVLPDEIDSTNPDLDYIVKLSVKVEAIQYNRLKTFWDINSSEIS